MTSSTEHDRGPERGDRTLGSVRAAGGTGAVRERCDAQARWAELAPAYEALAADIG